MDIYETFKSQNHCARCLLETEESIKHGISEGLNPGNILRYETYRLETAELQTILLQYKPSRILEVGSGTGRIVDTILHTLPECEIIGVDKEIMNVEFLHERFQKNKNVVFVGNDINAVDFPKVDLALCMMNGLGTINDASFMSKLIHQSNRVIFTVCNSRYDQERGDMYRARGHKKFHFDGEKYCFKDERCQGMVSRSYDKEKIYNLVGEWGGEVEECNQLGILYFVVVRKRS